MKQSTRIKKYAKQPTKFKKDLEKKDTNAWLILGFALIVLAILGNLLWLAGLLVLIYVVYLWSKTSKKRKRKN